VVAHLGELKARAESGWVQLARRLDRKDRPQPTLFDPPAHRDPEEGRWAGVKIKGVRLERLRDFGDVWLALGLWRLLGLDALLARVMPPGREDVPWPVVAAILAIARFCEPSSELHIEDTWYRRTALDDLLGVAAEQVHTDRLYAGLDQLLPHKAAIEAHLWARLGDLFDLKYDLLLYDVTSTYFEGECLGNPMAKRGYSRDSRPDCPQVCIGLVVTTDGIPLGYEVFDGNTHDATTVEQIVEAMEAKYGRADRVWVMDRGMGSEANLAFIRGRGGSYIVGTPKAMLRQFKRHLVEKDWREVQAGVEVKLVPGPDGRETFILARSRDRREKEMAMHERVVGRMEEGLKKLAAAAARGRLKDAGEAHRRLGRLQERYWRASGAFAVAIAPLAQPQGKAHLSVTWKRNGRWSEWAAVSEGCYLLRTNLVETDPAVLWKFPRRNRRTPSKCSGNFRPRTALVPPPRHFLHHNCVSWANATAQLRAAGLSTRCARPSGAAENTAFRAVAKRCGRPRKELTTFALWCLQPRWRGRERGFSPQGLHYKTAGSPAGGAPSSVGSVSWPARMRGGGWVGSDRPSFSKSISCSASGSV
jgi:hypothetical protein